MRQAATGGPSVVRIPLGGGGGGGRAPVSVMRPMDDRGILEQALGGAVLDRMNGYPVSSLALRYKELGGTNETVMKTLERAFGDNFDAVMASGETRKKLTAALSASLAEEGLRIPVTKAFRDMTFHLGDEFADFRKTMRQLANDTPS